MTTVNGLLIGPAHPERVEITAVLVDVTGDRVLGYVAGMSGEVVQPQRITAGTDGAWSADLIPNSQIDSAAGDTLWCVTEGRAPDGTPNRTYIAVPATGGPYWLGALRADLSGTQTGTGTVVYLAGEQGPAGASAYQTWLAAGHTGTEADFLASLVGPPGQDGAAGTQTPVGAAGAGDTIALRSTDPSTTNARTPTAHHASHATGGSDPLTPADIGADTAGAAAAAVSTHTAASDPHGDRAAASTALAGHMSAADPHGDRAAAASALDAHVTAADPHGDRAAASSALADHVAAVDPHGDRAYTDTQIATRAPTTRQITAGTGLTGGGSLAADRTLSVTYGTTAGTAAQGNDARLSDARTPSGSAGGDLSGTYPNPSVAKVGGVAVSGTPASGQVLTATGAAAASWQTPASSGGGGSSVRTAKVRVANDDLSGLPAAGSWTVVQTSLGTKLQCSITASPGDRIKVFGRFMRKGAHFLDWVLLDSAGNIAVYSTTDSATAPSEGDPALYPSLSFSYETGPPLFVVGAGHIDGTGKVTIALAHQGTATGSSNIVYAHSVYPFRMMLENIGPEPA